MLESILCAYSDSYILVTGPRSISGVVINQSTIYSKFRHKKIYLNLF